MTYDLVLDDETSPSHELDSAPNQDQRVADALSLAFLATFFEEIAEPENPTKT